MNILEKTLNNNFIGEKMNFLVFIFISTIISMLSLNVTAKTGPAHDKIVVCYISSWAVYRTGRGSFSLDNFDPNLCTHAVYAFAGLNITTNHIISLDKWQDLKDDYGKGGYEKLNSYKTTHPHLKVLLAIGGWNEGSTNYSILAADPNRRKVFVNQVSEFVRKYNFDGLDLDWEYPTQREGKAYDKLNFVHLVRELKEELGKYNLLLTSAFGASKKIINEAYDVTELGRLLDFMHIMCYDYGGSWDRKVTFNAPLTDITELNVMATINHLIELGAPRNKIIVGVPFYGRTFNSTGMGYLSDPTDDKGFAGPYTKESGFMGYNEICEAINEFNSSWKVDWYGPATQAILRREYPNGTNVVTYDNTRAIANKMRYIVKENLGGAMIWSIDTDDFLGECLPEKDTYADFKGKPGVNIAIPRRTYNNFPLLRTVNEAIVVSLDEVEQENIIKKDNKGMDRDDKEKEKDDKEKEKDDKEMEKDDREMEKDDKEKEINDNKEKDKENEIPHGKDENKSDDKDGASNLRVQAFLISIFAIIVSLGFF